MTHSVLWGVYLVCILQNASLRILISAALMQNVMQHLFRANRAKRKGRSPAAHFLGDA